MNKNIKRLAALLMIFIMTMAVITGCGSKKPKAEDAQAYVQAVLDLLCTGDYDHSVKIADLETDGEGTERDALIDDMMDTVSTQLNLSEENQTLFKDFLIKALSKAKYTVGDAVAADDGGFDVTVSIEPLKLYEGAMEEFQAGFPGNLGYSENELAAMSQDELNNVVMAAVINLLSGRLDSPTYGDAEDVVVHYGLLDEEQNMWGCSEEEGAKLGEKLFSTEGL